MIFTYEEVLQEFRQAVERSIADANRVPGRNADPGQCAKEIWESSYGEVLHEGVLDEYKGRETLVSGQYTANESYKVK